MAPTAERNEAWTTGGWRNVEHWITIHWFELATLTLLCLNLWFLTAVLSVLRSVNNWLMYFARWAQRDSSVRNEAD